MIDYIQCHKSKHKKKTQCVFEKIKTYKPIPKNENCQLPSVSKIGQDENIHGGCKYKREGKQNDHLGWISWFIGCIHT